MRPGGRWTDQGFTSTNDDGGAAVPNEDTAGVGGAPATESGAVTGKKPGLLSGLRDWRLRFARCGTGFGIRGLITARVFGDPTALLLLGRGR